MTTFDSWMCASAVAAMTADATLQMTLFAVRAPVLVEGYLLQ